MTAKSTARSAIKSATLACLLGACMVASNARAQAPALYSTVWTPEDMSIDQCMERATRAMHRAGTDDVTVKSPAPDLGWVDARFGNYTARIDCLMFRGMVVFMVAGPNGETAGVYQDELIRWTKGR
jgi:hypothetical protein